MPTIFSEVEYLKDQGGRVPKIFPKICRSTAIPILGLKFENVKKFPQSDLDLIHDRWMN